VIYSNEDLQRAICAARSVIVAHLKDGGKIEEIAGFSPTNWAQVVTSWATATAKGQPAPAVPLSSDAELMTKLVVANAEVAEMNVDLQYRLAASEAAAGQLRAALEKIDKGLDDAGEDPYIYGEVTARDEACQALATDAGKDWVSPKEAERLRKEHLEDLNELRADRDNQKTWSVALYAHVCRLTGADPRNGPNEILTIAASHQQRWEEKCAQLCREATIAEAEKCRAIADEHLSKAFEGMAMLINHTVCASNALADEVDRVRKGGV